MSIISEKAHIIGGDFLNVDLEILSRTSLQPLIESLGKNVFVLYVGRRGRLHFATCELARRTKDADSTIYTFCEIIASLPRPAAILWRKATSREFNVGIQAGRDFRHPFETTLGSKTLEFASKLGARIGLTIYAPAEQEKLARGRARKVHPKS